MIDLGALTDEANLIVSVATIISFVAIGIRWLVKHYLKELKPNSGSSMNDRLKRVENQIDMLVKHVIGDSV